jgi:hypothetical protein
MAIPVWQSSSTLAVFAASINLVKPPSTAAGDFLIASINLMDNTKTLTPPAGWTFIRQDLGGAGDTAINFYSYYRVADGSEGATFSFTTAGSSVMVGAISRITGVFSVTPINTHGGQVNNLSANGTAPSVTTTLADCLLYYAAAAQVQSNATPPGGMTERFDLDGSVSGIFGSIEGATEDRPTAGATGTRANTWGSAQDNAGQLVALNSAPTLQGAANLSGDGDLSATATATATGSAVLTGLGDLSASATTPLCQYPYIAYVYAGGFFCIDNLGNFATPVTSNVLDLCIVRC